MTRAPWAPPARRRDTLARIGRHLLEGTAAVAELLTPPPPPTRRAGRHAERGAVYGQPVRARRRHAHVRLASGVAVVLIVAYALFGACTVLF